MKDDHSLLVHIRHSKPIELSEFTTCLNAVGNLFSSYVQKEGQSKEMAQAKLYVSKIEEGSIDIILKEIVSATFIPFAENANTIFQFAAYLKGIVDYFTKGDGEKPALTQQECRNLRDVFAVTAGDNNGETEIGAICGENKGTLFQSCTFNFGESNSAQNQLSKEIERLKSVGSNDEVYKMQLMTLYQIRNDNTNIGNKAIIESISRKKLSVIFDSEDLKDNILRIDENPTRKGFIVDVSVMTAEGKTAVYKVLKLHEIVDLEDI